MATIAPAPAQVQTLSLEAALDQTYYVSSYARLPLVISFADTMDPEEWLRLLGIIWPMCDNISEHKEALISDTPFLSAVLDPEYGRCMMNEAEHMAFDALPATLTIYRGCYEDNIYGLSWSLDRDLAAGFPTLHRYKAEGTPLLVTAQIHWYEALALKLGRGETEIIANMPNIIAVAPLAPAVWAPCSLNAIR